MGRPAVAAFALVALAVAAGCGSIAAGGDGEATEAPTLTPAPVPTVTEESTTLPPGVTRDGVRNANALFQSHVAHLEGTSYTLSIRERTDDVAAEYLIRIERPDRFYRHDSIHGGRQVVVRFADGESEYVNSTHGGVTLLNRLNVTGPPTSHTVRLSKTFLRLDDAQVSAIRVDGDTYYEIRGEYDAHPHADRLENFSVRAVVSPDGFVRSLNVSYTEGRGSPTTVTRRFEYSDVGSTTVERPEWVRDHWDANTTRTPSTDGRRVGRLTDD